MLVTFITVIHVLVAFFLILVILLQAGKDAGMGAAFGGGGSGSVFGGRGAGNFLSRLTAISATVFFITSLSLSFAASYKPSVISTTTTSVQAPAAAPTAPAQQENAAPAPSAAAPAQGEAAAPAPAAPAAPAPAAEAPAAAAPAAPAAPAP